MMLTRSLFILVAIMFLVGGSIDSSYAWGERGHHAICEVATRIVEEPALRKLLVGKGHVMGHLCNIADVHWRDLGGKEKVGEPTHYLNPENAGFTIDKVPLTYRKYWHAANEKGVTEEAQIGSLWWRADQFYRRAFQSAKKIATYKQPEGAVRTIYNMMVDMGLMGHFVGDAAQTYHNVTDYDGWKVGRGGIHRYYETHSVNEFSFEFLSDLHERSQELREESPETGTVLERMKKLSIQAVGERQKIERRDKILTSSNEEAKKKAERPPYSEGAKRFYKLILPQLARAAALLAEFWDEIYREAGRPDLSGYASLRYPLAPNFVPPDYLLRRRKPPPPPVQTEPAPPAPSPATASTPTPLSGEE